MSNICQEKHDYSDLEKFIDKLNKYAHEKVMYDQPYEYREHFPNQLLCGFRKTHSTQHALFRLLQKWQKDLAFKQDTSEMQFLESIWHFNQSFVCPRKILGVARALVILFERYSLKPFSKLF